MLAWVLSIRQRWTRAPNPNPTVAATHVWHGIVGAFVSSSVQFGNQGWVAVGASTVLWNAIENPSRRRPVAQLNIH